MLSLNLVSAELKQEIKSKHIYTLLKKMNYILIIIAIIFSIILLTAKVILQNNFNKVVEQTTLVTSNSRSYIDEVKKINSQISSASEIQNDHIAWSNLLEKIAEMTPDGVTFKQLKISEKNKEIKIMGHADLRDDLIALKDNFENSVIFTDIESPIKNLLEKEDIDFELDMKINLNELLNFINSL